MKRIRAATIWGLIIALTAGSGMVGCTGFSQQARGERENAEAEAEASEAADRLFESMVQVFREETDGVDIESRRTLTVISNYESVAEQRRRRFVGRIVPAGGGVGVNITAEYQIDEATGDERPQWTEQPREQVESEAAGDELELARRIERLFHRGGPNG